MISSGDPHGPERPADVRLCEGSMCMCMCIYIYIYG